MYEHVLYMNVNTLSHPLRDNKRVMLESMMYEHAHPVVSKAERVVVAIYDCINFGKRVFTVCLALRNAQNACHSIVLIVWL